MKTIYNDIDKILDSKELKEIWDEEAIEGRIIYNIELKKIIYTDDIVSTWITDKQSSLSNVEMMKGKLINCSDKVCEFNGKYFDVKKKAYREYLFIFLRKQIEDSNDNSELISLRELNLHLQNVYENYTEDTITIVNKDGIVEFCGEACERQCGIPFSEMVGRKITDFSDAKYFYPLVTEKVMKTKKTEVVMQKTKIGVSLITVGIPILEKGEIKKVISISRDFSKEVEIASLLVKTKQDLEKSMSADMIMHEKIVTCSKKMYSILTLLKMVAQTDSTLLLAGKTGTGKTVMAEYVHDKSRRTGKPFLHVNCGAIPENIMESELYGYESGSFTGAREGGKKGIFETAEGGTVFLDEIGELPLIQQVKLLHVLQEGKIRRVGGSEEIKTDVRIIVATNRNLEEMVKDGVFREDLYYRINVVSIDIPDLRERKEDIPLLIRHFMVENQKKHGITKEISKAAIQRMCEYNWPGNVRELQNIVEMLIVTARTSVIDTEHLPEKINIQSNNGIGIVTINKMASLKEALEETEKKLIKRALEEGGNHKDASELLGVDRSTITKKVKKYFP